MLSAFLEKIPKVIHRFRYFYYEISSLNKNAEKIANKLEIVNIKYLTLKPDIIIIVKALNKYIAASDNEGEIININEGTITNKIPIKQCFLLLQL